MSALREPRVVLTPGAPFGAVVEGVDLTKSLPVAALALLQQALRDHYALVFPAQHLSPEQLIAATAQFGELMPAILHNPYGRPAFPEYPVLNRITNRVDAQGRAMGNGGSLRLAPHGDMTYLPEPPTMIALSAAEIDRVNADTLFWSMELAYASLPSDVRARLEGLRVVHDSAHNAAGLLRKGCVEQDDVRNTPGARHPIVALDPVTNLPTLYLGRRAHAYVVGLDVDASEALLDELWAHVLDDQFAWTHSWKLGDVVIWNNVGLVHARDSFGTDGFRTLHRAQIGSFIPTPPQTRQDACAPLGGNPAW